MSTPDDPQHDFIDLEFDADWDADIDRDHDDEREQHVDANVSPPLEAAVYDPWPIPELLRRAIIGRQVTIATNKEMKISDAIAATSRYESNSGPVIS